MMTLLAVALDRTAQPSCMAPCLLSVARPGTQIVFLIRAKARRSVWLEARMAALSTHHSVAVQVCQQKWRFALSHEKRLAEQRLEPLRAALLKHGAETEVQIYTGRLNKAVRDLGGNHLSSFAVLRPRKDWLGTKFVRAILIRAGVCLTDSASKASLVFWTVAQ